MKAELIDQLESMTKEEIYGAVFCDHLTGVLNRRAFECSKNSSLAIVDADSLKYFNDEYGHRWGDYILKAISKMLSIEFGKDNVYRLGGDEFAVKNSDPIVLRKKLTSLQKTLPCFSFGIGSNTTRADVNLKANKLRRESNGLRAERGERPKWAEQVLTSGAAATLNVMSNP